MHHGEGGTVESQYINNKFSREQRHIHKTPRQTNGAVQIVWEDKENFMAS